jgi:hypothetical protein
MITRREKIFISDTDFIEKTKFWLCWNYEIIGETTRELNIPRGTMINKVELSKLLKEKG